MSPPVRGNGSEADESPPPAVTPPICVVGGPCPAPRTKVVAVSFGDTLVVVVEVSPGNTDVVVAGAVVIGDVVGATVDPTVGGMVVATVGFVVVGTDDCGAQPFSHIA
jgi:hypothetical protein